MGYLSTPKVIRMFQQELKHLPAIEKNNNFLT